MAFTKTRLNEEAVKRLIALYEQVGKKLIDGFDSATDFGRAERLAILSQVKKELTDLGVKTQAWLDKELPLAYKDGMVQALDQLEKLQAATPFYHGHGGGSISISGGNMFGKGFYISEDPKVARQFGNKVDKVYLNIFDRKQILRISTQEEYDKLMEAAIRAYPKLTPEEAIPKYAQDKGFKAILGTTNFDPLAGIAVFDKSLLSKNPILPVKTLFTQPNKAQVSALVDDASKAFGEAMSTVNRTVTNITAKAFQQETRARIAEGTLSSDTRKQIVASVKEQLKSNGLTALTDRGGRSWSLDRYADMLVRTKLTEARNTGLANKMLENDQDLVQVSINGSSHPLCAEYEGQVLSVTGATPGYDTVDDATADGLFHPNCMHTINPIEPDLAKQTYGWDVDKQEYDTGIFDDTIAGAGAD